MHKFPWNKQISSAVRSLRNMSMFYMYTKILKQPIPVLSMNKNSNIFLSSASGTYSISSSLLPFTLISISINKIQSAISHNVCWTWVIAVSYYPTCPRLIILSWTSFSPRPCRSLTSPFAVTSYVRPLIEGKTCL